jgi:hypothetical protein
MTDSPKVILKLTLKDRIIAGSVLGAVKQAQFADWKLIDEWMDVFGLKTETFEEFGIENGEGGLITWKDAAKAAEERDYAVTTGSFELFKKKVLEQERKEGISKDLKEVVRKLGILS